MPSLPSPCTLFKSVIHIETIFVYLYLFLAVLDLCCCTWAFSSCGEGGYSFLWCMGVPLQWPLLLQSTGPRVWAQELWQEGLAALWHLGVFPASDGIHVPSIGRRILNHWITTEVPGTIFI